MQQIGKTLRMVMALPEADALVVVHTGVMVDYVRRMIRAFRGAHVELATKVLAIRSCHEAERHLTGQRREIHVDHAFWERSRQDVVAMVRELKGAIDAIRAPAARSELSLEIGRLELRHDDIVVIRTKRLTDEQACRYRDRIVGMAIQRHVFGVDVMFIEPGVELSIIRPAPDAQEPRRTPFGCPEAPERLPADAVTSASISEAFGAPPAAGALWVAGTPHPTTGG